MNVKTYVIRVPGGYLCGLDLKPVPLEHARIFPDAKLPDLLDVREAVTQARWGRPPAEVWAVEVTVAVVDGKPCFALGDQA